MRLEPAVRARTVLRSHLVHAEAEQPPVVGGDERGHVRPVLDVRRAPCEEQAVECGGVVRADPGEQRHVVRPGEDVDRVDLQRRHARHRRFSCRVPAASGRRCANPCAARAIRRASEMLSDCFTAASLAAGSDTLGGERVAESSARRAAPHTPDLLRTPLDWRDDRLRRQAPGLVLGFAPRPQSCRVDRRLRIRPARPHGRDRVLVAVPRRRRGDRRRDLARHPAQAARHPVAGRDPGDGTAVAGVQLDAAPPRPAMARDRHLGRRHARDRRRSALARGVADHPSVVIRAGPHRRGDRPVPAVPDRRPAAPDRGSDRRPALAGADASSRSRPSCFCRAPSRSAPLSVTSPSARSSRSSSCCACSPTAAGIWRWTTRLFPIKARPAVDGAGRAGWVMVVNYARTQLLVATIDAIGIGLGAFLLGVPLAIPVAVLVFLGAFVPIVGAVFTGYSRGLPRSRLQRSVDRAVDARRRPGRPAARRPRAAAAADGLGREGASARGRARGRGRRHDRRHPRRAVRRARSPRSSTSSPSTSEIARGRRARSPRPAT